MYMYHQVNSLEQYPVKGQIIHKLLTTQYLADPLLTFGSEMGSDVEINSSPLARVVQEASSTLPNELKRYPTSAVLVQCSSTVNLNHYIPSPL